MRIRSGHIVMTTLMATGLPVRALDGHGLQATDSSWFHGRWQARIELSQSLSGPRQFDPYNLTADTRRNAMRRLSVLRDYYFDWRDDDASVPASVGGLRATGGLVVTSRSATNLPSPRRAGGSGVSSQGLTSRAIAGGWPNPNNDLVSVPYVGVGYTELPIRSGWGFRADLGLMALRAQSAVKFGSALSGPQGLDDVLRDMRLSPLIKIGVSYSF